MAQASMAQAGVAQAGMARGAVALMWRTWVGLMQTVQ